MRIAIIDDKKEDRNYLNGVIRECFSNYGYLVSVIDMFENGQDFLKKFIIEKYDFIFLDILMDTLNGIEVAKNIRELDQNVKLIFTSISNDFASESYHVNADSYLLKPINVDDLSHVIDKLNISDIYNHRVIHLPTGKSLFLHSILYTSFHGHYVTIYCRDGNQIKIRCTQKEVLQWFNPYSDFVSCTKGIIVNLNHISRLNDDCFIMSNGVMIPISRRKYQSIKQLYSDFCIEKIRKGNI